MKPSLKFLQASQKLKKATFSTSKVFFFGRNKGLQPMQGGTSLFNDPSQETQITTMFAWHISFYNSKSSRSFYVFSFKKRDLTKFNYFFQIIGQAPTAVSKNSGVPRFSRAEMKSPSNLSNFTRYLVGFKPQSSAKLAQMDLSMKKTYDKQIITRTFGTN